MQRNPAGAEQRPEVVELRERAAGLRDRVLRLRVEGRIEAALELRRKADALLLDALALCRAAEGRAPGDGQRRDGG